MNTIETTEFEIVPADMGLEPAAKHSLEIAFTGFFSRAREIAKKAANVTEAKAARTLRLELKSERVAAEKIRKSLKEDSLRMGKAIDGANNIYLALVVPIEKQMEEIEKAEERAEATRIEAIREERAETLDSMGHVSHGVNLGAMSEPGWTAYLQQAKDVYEMRQIRAKREAEEAAAELARQEAVWEAQRLEAIRLREEAAAAAAALEAERKERAAAEAKAREEQTRKDAAVRDAMEKQRAAAKADMERTERAAAEERRKAQEVAAIETAKRQKAEAEAQALREAEAKRIAEAEAAEAAKAKAEIIAAKKAAAAPDKAKLLHFAEVVRHLDVPLANSEAGQRVAAEVAAKCEGFAKWIEAQAATL